jgi:hypothetical protein
MFTQFLTARWRVALACAVLLLLIAAVTWLKDMHTFHSEYLDSITGKISNALPDWASSKQQAESVKPDEFSIDYAMLESNFGEPEQDSSKDSSKDQIDNMVRPPRCLN